MTNDGKHLEELVAFVEKELLPQGFDVKSNTRIYNDEGIQIAEFDIEIRGRLGSTEIAWLVECRDRPGEGPAPGSWIEQLFGRRSRFGFNKVTAVSTTGFASGAKDFAKQSGIELREVKTLTPEHLANWMHTRHMQFSQNILNLEAATVFPVDAELIAKKNALEDALSGKRLDEPVLRSTVNGSLLSAVEAFTDAVSNHQILFEGILPNQPGRQVKLRARYPNDDSHYTVDTALGEIRIAEILFIGELSITETLVPLSEVLEYAKIETGDPISQVAAFSFSAPNTNFSLELHRLEETGGIYVSISQEPKV